MIKLIATDMDRTFLDSSKRFSMEFFDIFTELQKKELSLSLLQEINISVYIKNFYQFLMKCILLVKMGVI